MIHTIHTLSIRQYGIIDSTENLSLLRRWWNPLPVGWFDVQKVITEIGRSLNSGIDKMIVYEASKIILLNKIMMLEALYNGIYNLIVLKPFNDSFGITKKNKTNLTEYIKMVEKITTIMIKDLDGLKRLKNEIQRLGDKFTERFKEQPKGKSIPFIQYAYSVFALMEMPYNPDLKMSEFFDMIITADKKATQLDKLRNKNG
jgi:hypothetical protein